MLPFLIIQKHKNNKINTAKTRNSASKPLNKHQYDDKKKQKILTDRSK